MNGAWVLASETIALDLIHAEFVRDVEPGEIVIINEKGLDQHPGVSRTHSSAPSAFLNTSISPGRTASSPAAAFMKSARKWAANWRANIPSRPTWSFPCRTAACAPRWAIREESGIPYEMAFIRNHYVGRSFLQPSQLIRDFNVRVKLNLIESLVKDKRVVIVDDSIVRGTTCQVARENAEGGRREGSSRRRQLSAAHESVRLWH